MRVATVQDLSCFGKCALTMALPVLSAMGHETGVLPTALLSTHTGGLGKPYVRDLTADSQAILDHWQAAGVRFDALLTGYLGSIPAMESARRVARDFLAPGGVVICDPAMADRGRMYAGLGEEYAKAMTALCLEADLMLPNLTEASIMTGVAIPDGEDDGARRGAVERMLGALRKRGARCVVLKGYPGVGQSVMDEAGRIAFVPARAWPGHYHGTGDLFAAALCGAYLNGQSLADSARLAGELVERSIESTRRAGQDERMGVRFEEALPFLIGNRSG